MISNPRIRNMLLAIVTVRIEMGFYTDLKFENN